MSLHRPAVVGRRQLTLYSDWVHDRYEDERQRYDRSQRRGPIDDDRYDSRNAGP